MLILISLKMTEISTLKTNISKYHILCHRLNALMKKTKEYEKIDKHVDGDIQRLKLTIRSAI